MYIHACSSRRSFTCPRSDISTQIPLPCRIASYHVVSVVTPLVRAGRSLASLELLEIPVADLHVAAVLVQALCEALGGAGTVVVLLVLLGRSLGLDRSSGFGGAAAEEAAEGVADGGADGDTAVRD